MKTIVIDAGHGGDDWGAVNGNRKEKDDNLRLALALRQKLLNQGQRVVMTRDNDVFVSLLGRSEIANDSNGDLFISLHRNAVENNPSANGVENWVYTTASPSEKNYAQTVLDRVVEVGVQSNRGVKAGNFSVLRNTRIPAMLLEMGFISNARDNELFDQHLDAYAAAIAQGILESLGESAKTPGTPSDAVIRSLQTTLNNRYQAGLTVDGRFGPQTKRALVAAFQTEIRQTHPELVVDGLFGPLTQAKAPIVTSGSVGALVYLLQAALYVQGFPVTLDSVFGPNTRQAVISFQKSAGLTPDGIAGPLTWARLLG